MEKGTTRELNIVNIIIQTKLEINIIIHTQISKQRELVESLTPGGSHYYP